MCGLITSWARNGSHRPILIVPCIRIRAVRASGAPGETAAFRYRSTGSGRPSSSPGENTPGCGGRTTRRSESVVVRTMAPR